MATYPRIQSEISALVGSMIAGYTEHPGDFPSADVAVLQTARDEYRTTSEALADAQAAAKLAAVEKAEKLERLQAVMKAQLKRSQVDTASQPEKLALIGWGPKADPQSMQVSSPPTNLKITAQGIIGEEKKGLLGLQWEKSAFKRARFVRYYCVERRHVQSNGDGETPVGPWGHIASVIDNKIALKEEPTGVRMEYRIKAVNKGGQSMPSNTIAVVL